MKDLIDAIDMSSDRTQSALTPPQNGIVKSESVESLVLSREQLRPEDLGSEPKFQQDNHKVEDTRDTKMNELTGCPDTQWVKQEKPKVDIPERAVAGTATGHLSDTDDESRPSSPVSKGVNFEFQHAEWELDHRLYFFHQDHPDGGPSIYCWGVRVGTETESCICKVQPRRDGNLKLELCAMFSHLGGGGPCVSSMGLYFHLPNLQERALYRMLMSPDKCGYERVTLHPEYEHLMAYRGPDASADGSFTQHQHNPLQPLGPGVSTPQGLPSYQFDNLQTPGFQSPGSHESSGNGLSSPTPSSPGSHPVVSTYIQNGAIYITDADTSRLTPESVDDFVDNHLFQQPGIDRIYCQICPAAKHDKPRKDCRPYALKASIRGLIYG